MKINKLFLVAFAGIALASCSDIDNIAPESGTMLASQVQETNALAPSRAAASFNGMFTNIGKPCKAYSTPDDWQFLMINFCNDLEGADALIADSGYNWFSVCGEYSSRSADYRNPLIRYQAPYTMIGDANTFLGGFSDDVTDPSILNMIAQAKALRAYSYLCLVRAYQFNYQIAADKPSVPIVTLQTEDYTQNPRATVKEVYDLIITDLSEAIEGLEGASRNSKMYIDGNVAHGLRARAYLDMGEWQKALDDAKAAAEGYTPASIAEVSVPSFMSLDEHNWIWGYDCTDALTKGGNRPYATPSGWLRSFSANGYAPATQTYTCVNTMLWDKIPATDVRKGWWVDEDLKSPLIDGLTWPGLSGTVATSSDGGDSKLPFLPYTNVKFGCLTVGTTVNDEDTPLMRVEEMILIQAECQYRLGQADQAKTTLETFVKTYRDPAYSSSVSGRDFLDEIWFQRRVELWGEGFYVPDMHRLNKPLVRFHGEGTSNQPETFAFNMKADDGWFLMRFPQREMNTNFGVVDNTDGTLPKMGQNPELRDGVTD